MCYQGLPEIKKIDRSESIETNLISCGNWTHMPPIMKLSVPQKFGAALTYVFVLVRRILRTYLVCSYTIISLSG